MRSDSNNIIQDIQKKQKSIVKDSGVRIQILEDARSKEIAKKNSCKMHDVYLESLRLGIIPYRYIRNTDSIRPEDQLKLAKSRVAVVGTGGLGGQALHLLARLGIGYLTIVDHDLFDETNLNRQAFSTVNSIGKSKAETAEKELNTINPGVETVSHQVRINSANAINILEGSDVIVDALDNIPDRFLLESAARELEIPFVHAAIAGFEGRIMTILPKDIGLEAIYGRETTGKERAVSPESILGVPALTPAAIASFQVMEVLKIILNKGSVKQSRMLHIDIETGQTNEFNLDPQDKQV